MSSRVQEMTKKGLIKPPSFLPENVMYEVMMGSVAYGVSEDTSDFDVYGFCIPPRDLIFLHLRGEISGFGKQTQRFNQYQQHHVFDKDARGGKGIEYDFTIFSIVRYFQLCLENNPNALDSLFVPQSCVLHYTAVGNMVREQRKAFLHKGCFHRFKGYAFSQLHKMKSQTRKGKRAEVVEEYGFDLKFAYHVVRLIGEVEEILSTGDLNLQESGRREHMKAIRRGEVPLEEIVAFFTEKEKQLEKLYEKSSLPHSPDENRLKALLMECLEHHYGSLDKVIVVDPNANAIVALRKIQEVIEENRKLLS